MSDKIDDFPPLASSATCVALGKNTLGFKKDIFID